MRVLALDTTTRAGSVALVDDHSVIAERAGDAARAHAERLPAEITELLGECGVRIEDIDLFAVAAGPGSFTGLRIGIATIQGLALVTRGRVVGVSALDALAHCARAGREGERVGAWMDARRNEVFAALYVVPEGEPSTAGLIEVDAAAVGAPLATLTRWEGSLRLPATFIGDGAVLYAELIHAQLGRGVVILDPPPLAATIGRLAVARARESVDPGGLRPLYVRRPDAEIDRDRRTVHS
jgi:tRNA threonylcarbamoyladenosine biosynthesis protein TsaB